MQRAFGMLKFRAERVLKNSSVLISAPVKPESRCGVQIFSLFRRSGKEVSNGEKNVLL